MTGLDPPAMVMDQPSLLLSTLTRPVGMDGFVSIDGVRSRKSTEIRRKHTGLMQIHIVLLCQLDHQNYRHHVLWL